MRVLITGSSGEIGTNLALRLLDEGVEVFGLDKRPSQWTDAFPYTIQDMAQLYSGFSSFTFGEKQYPEADVIVHLAANAKVHASVENPCIARENIISAWNAVEFARQNRIPIILASSREVYGNVRRSVTEEWQTHVDDSASPYSAGKLASEAIVSAHAQCYGLPYIIFRFSNVYGRFDNDLDRMERVIPLFINRIARGEKITVFGEKKTLDFTYVDDTVDGIYRSIVKLVQGDVKNETFNLSFGAGHTLVELAQMIGDELGENPDMTIVPARSGEIEWYVGGIEKARNYLGYNPKTPLKEGLKKAIAWQNEQETAMWRTVPCVGRGN